MRDCRSPLRIGFERHFDRRVNDRFHPLNVAIKGELAPMRLVCKCPLLFVAMLAMLATHVNVASAQSEETVDALSAQAEALYKAGKHAEAAAIAERAVAVAERQFGPDHLAMAAPL